jgi:hypothetical protein
MEQLTCVQHSEDCGRVAKVGACLAPGGGRSLGQVLPGQQLHGVVAASGVGAVVVDLDDARMAQAGQHAELALEQRMRGGIGVRGQALDGHRAATGAIEGLIDRAHAALSEQTTNLIATPNEGSLFASGGNRRDSHELS